ncbi:hypothetical protein BD779DRAFT_1466904 [Infundibulicybe gibba]|nr:hypothetical protein BD779DRAFT_1466904 [Infundibulicybe gibba]
MAAINSADPPFVTQQWPCPAGSSVAPEVGLCATAVHRIYAGNDGRTWTQFRRCSIHRRLRPGLRGLGLGIPSSAVFLKCRVSHPGWHFYVDPWGGQGTSAYIGDRPPPAETPALQPCATIPRTASGAYPANRYLLTRPPIGPPPSPQHVSYIVYLRVLMVKTIRYCALIQVWIASI